MLVSVLGRKWGLSYDLFFFFFFFRKVTIGQMQNASKFSLAYGRLWLRIVEYSSVSGVKQIYTG